MKATIFRVIIAAIAVIVCSTAWAGLYSPSKSSAVEGLGTLPQITTFQADPADITRGGSSVLSWKAENAVTVSIDPNVGGVSQSGQLTVTPLYSTTYKLAVSNSTGIRTRYLTLRVTEIPPDGHGTVGADPVTGRNSPIDLSWEDYCYSSDYQVQIARDAAFTLKVYDSGALQPADSVYPAFSYPPGRLEAGHTYYWRVRSVRSVTGQWAISPWSEARPITVSPGFPVRADTYGVQALSPVNNTVPAAAIDSSNTDKLVQNTPAPPQDTPIWAIAVIIFGSLLVGAVLVVTIREGKKI